MAKPLFIHCVGEGVREGVHGLWAHCDAVLDGCPHSDVPIDSLAYMAEYRPGFQVDTGAAPRGQPRGLHTNTHTRLYTYKHGNTITS